MSGKASIVAIVSVFLVIGVSGGPCKALAAGKNIGVLGPVYPIEEQDFLAYIQHRLEELKASGDLQKLHEREVRIAKERINHPKAVPGISRTKTPRVFHVDPSLKLDHAVRDATGRVLFMPGTKVNPFDYFSLSKHLLFIDGRDKQQRLWAERMFRKYQGHVKTILIAGSPIDLMNRWDRRVYFDQQGVLSRKLRIRHVPAIVSQDGKMLRVAEMLP